MIYLALANLGSWIHLGSMISVWFVFSCWTAWYQGVFVGIYWVFFRWCQELSCLVGRSCSTDAGTLILHTWAIMVYYTGWILLSKDIRKRRQEPHVPARELWAPRAALTCKVGSRAGHRRSLTPHSIWFSSLYEVLSEGAGEAALTCVYFSYCISACGLWWPMSC